MITPPPRPRRLRLVAGSYRLGPVEEGTVVAHHHWGYEVRLHETGDIVLSHDFWQLFVS